MKCEVSWVVKGEGVRGVLVRWGRECLCGRRSCGVKGIAEGWKVKLWSGRTVGAVLWWKRGGGVERAEVVE